MKTNLKSPKEYRVHVEQDFVRNVKSPYDSQLSIIHAFVKIKDFPNGLIPDKVNPRSHEKIKMKSRVPEAIRESLHEYPRLFHLLNRGCLILAEKAWYDNKNKTLHFVVQSEDQHGMVDGATTDRVLSEVKSSISEALFESLKDSEIPDYLKEAYLHLEIISGLTDDDTRIRLAQARNTSEQVKDFSIEDLGGGYDWLKEVLERSELKGKIRYRENEPKPFDIRSVLALLTLFHCKWDEIKKEPIVAYTGKGAVLDIYKKDDWREKYEDLAPVVVEILKLYEYVHANFQTQYQKAYGKNAKLGRRREVRYLRSSHKKVLPLTNKEIQYVIPDGWLYPLLGSFRALLRWPRGRGRVEWKTDPFKFFDDYGWELVSYIVSQSEQLGNNPNATGKSSVLWGSLRDKVENKILRIEAEQD
ncbi:MAG TPA: AIPR family protein [Anaerohalosphaeraceae bacterium]|nr:AIPR family protein [Anaerohalosphaeraceae bacterium]HOL88802.1 AIPR family protein [Anaerohalosphaeraceae bacterium]HPP55688.1 AIPR family protein [Anaerohalosphaeraceae bacterium]